MTDPFDAANTSLLADASLSPFAWYGISPAIYKCPADRDVKWLQEHCASLK